MNQTPEQIRNEAFAAATRAGCISGCLTGLLAFAIFAAIPPTRPIAIFFALGGFLVGGFRVFGTILANRSGDVHRPSASLDQKIAQQRADLAELERKIAEEKARRGLK